MVSWVTVSLLSFGMERNPGILLYSAFGLKQFPQGFSPYLGTTDWLFPRSHEIIVHVYSFNDKYRERDFKSKIDFSVFFLMNIMIFPRNVHINDDDFKCSHSFRFVIRCKSYYFTQEQVSQSNFLFNIKKYIL